MTPSWPSWLTRCAPLATTLTSTCWWSGSISSPGPAAGALKLRRRDLDARRATLWLREKGASEREQPVSPTLVSLLERQAKARGAGSPDDAVFRTKRGAPISRRRYDTIFARASACLVWSDRIPVSAHVLRHTAITAVGRLAGYPVAQTFAGHSPPLVTGLYLQASPAEVAAAVAGMTGEAHPLADADRWKRDPVRRPTCHRQ